MLSFHFFAAHATLVLSSVSLHCHPRIRLLLASALLDMNMLTEAWRHCVQDFLRSKHDHSGSEQTLSGYRSVLFHFLARISSPETATRQDVEHFLHTPLDRYTPKEPAPATRNRRLAILSSFYHYASTYLVAGVPLMRTASPTLGITRSVAPQQYRAFTPSDLQKFFAAIPTDTIRGLRDRALFACLFWCARRRAEIVNLCYGDLFSGIVIDADGTRRTAYLYRFRNKGQKSGYDVAELPLPAKIAIDKYLVASGRLATIEAEDALFIAYPPPNGGGLPIDPYRAMTGQSVWVALKKYARAANLDFRKLDVHSLRHSAARERYNVNPDVREIQQILRHSNLSTTDRYLHTLVQTGDQTAKLLEERFGDLF